MKKKHVLKPGFQSAFKSSQKGPPRTVLGGKKVGPGAAQTPKIDDFRSVKKPYIKNLAVKKIEKFNAARPKDQEKRKALGRSRLPVGRPHPEVDRHGSRAGIRGAPSGIESRPWTSMSAKALQLGLNPCRRHPLEASSSIWLLATGPRNSRLPSRGPVVCENIVN